MAKERLDVLLVNRNLIDTREKAKRMIMAGLVFSEQERMDKPGMKVNDSIPLHIKGRLPYVSRGGLKLEKALQVFHTTVKDKVIVDVGASTGGFTDCALQNGAAYIYAVDVGYNQLAWKMRNHPQVEVHEKTNFRYITQDFFQNGHPTFAMMDVSFISIKIMLPVLQKVLQPGSDIVTLIKPQFEARREDVGRKGIVRDINIHQKIVQEMIVFAADLGLSCMDITYSPITGGEGNKEFLVHFQKNEQAFNHITESQVVAVVTDAHQYLTK